MTCRPNHWHRLLLALTAFMLFSLPACTGTDSGDDPGRGLSSLNGDGIFPTGTNNDSTDGGSGSTSSEITLSSEESAFVTLINSYRAQNGLGALRVSVTLTKASQWLSADMAEKGYFSHNDSQGRDPFTRMTDFGYSQNSYSGENIAAGNASAQETFTQWRNSSGHNANMLGSNYKVLGVGRVQGSGGGYGWYWTTNFGSIIDKTL